MEKITTTKQSSPGEKILSTIGAQVVIDLRVKILDSLKVSVIPSAESEDFSKFKTDVLDYLGNQENIPPELENVDKMSVFNWVFLSSQAEQNQ